MVRTVVCQDPAPVASVRPARRLSGEPYALPEDAVEWIEALRALRQEVARPRVAPFREYLARACESTAQVLRAGASDRSEAPDAAGVRGPARPERLL